MDELPIWFSMPAGRCGRLDVSFDRLWNTLKVDVGVIDDIKPFQLIYIDWHASDPLTCIGFCTDAVVWLVYRSFCAMAVVWSGNAPKPWRKPGRIAFAL